MKKDRKEYMKKYAEEHKEQNRKRAREYYYNNKEKVKKYRKEYLLKHPEYIDKMKEYKLNWERNKRKKAKLNQERIDKVLDYIENIKNSDTEIVENSKGEYIDVGYAVPALEDIEDILKGEDK